MPSSRFQYLSLALLVCPPTIALFGQRKNDAITPEDYWYFEKSGEIQRIVIGPTEISGIILGPIDQPAFRIERRLLSDSAAKVRGILQLLDDLIYSIGYAEEHKDAVLAKKERLSVFRLTGLNFGKASEWKNWIERNRKFMYWSEPLNRLAIDDEARKANTPALEYRKKHPLTRPRKPVARPKETDLRSMLVRLVHFPAQRASVDT